jgi:peptidoglycan/LPS O-acetylase OafA/YrhL
MNKRKTYYSRDDLLCVESNKLDLLVIFDGVAIFFIVLFHQLGGYPNNPLFFLLPYLVSLGLALFTFSAGYKLIFNHISDIEKKSFLGTYFIKRFVRLYKPYLGYSFLTLIPLLLIMYSAFYYLHLNFPGISNFLHWINNMNLNGCLVFFFGENPVASQLWYLIALIGITSICFSLLYFFRLKWLFISFILFFLISILIKIEIIHRIYSIAANIFLYLPFFILGCYWAHNQNVQKNTRAEECISVLFLVFIIISGIVQNPGNKSLLIHLSCFSFPFFVSSISNFIKKIELLRSFLMFCGKYSFQIYLFQWPLILPILSRTIIDIMKIDYVFMPVVISIVAIYVCVAIYKITKITHLNLLFE